MVGDVLLLGWILVIFQISCQHWTLFIKNILKPYRRRMWCPDIFMKPYQVHTASCKLLRGQLMANWLKHSLLSFNVDQQAGCWKSWTLKNRIRRLGDIAWRVCFTTKPRVFSMWLTWIGIPRLEKPAFESAIRLPAPSREWIQNNIALRIALHDCTWCFE